MKKKQKEITQVLHSRYPKISLSKPNRSDTFDQMDLGRGNSWLWIPWFGFILSCEQIN